MREGEAMGLTRVIGSLLAVPLLAVGALTPPVDYSEGHSDISPEDLVVLEEFFWQYDISEADQVGLLDKLARGEVWDSLLGVEAVETQFESDMYFDRVIERYPDGSVHIGEIEKSISGPAPKGISGCRLVSGSNYHSKFTGCKAKHEFGVIMQAFQFDKTTLKGAVGTIDRAYAQEDRCIGCTLAQDRFDVISPSQRRFSQRYSAIAEGFPVTWTLWIQANLRTGNDHYMTNN